MNFQIHKADQNKSLALEIELVARKYFQILLFCQNLSNHLLLVLKDTLTLMFQTKQKISKIFYEIYFFVYLFLKSRIYL
jgi:hypothetical protein